MCLGLLLVAAPGAVLPASAQFTPTNVAGCVLWLDGGDVDGDGDAEGEGEAGLTGTRVDTWVNKAAANHATIDTGSPSLATNALNGRDVIRLARDGFKLAARISNIRTVFWVLREDLDGGASPFLLGDTAQYHFHRGGGTPGPFWDSTYVHLNIRNGVTRRNGSVVNGLTTGPATGAYQVVALVTSGNVQADRITQDRGAQYGNRTWAGDFAELLVYNAPLVHADRVAVEHYLQEKWLGGAPVLPVHTNGFVWKRATDFVPWSPNPAPDRTGTGVWHMVYTTGGDLIGAGETAGNWWKQAGTPLTWDWQWFTNPFGAWTRGENLEPIVIPQQLELGLNAAQSPLVRWVNPVGDNVVLRIDGTVTKGGNYTAHSFDYVLAVRRALTGTWQYITRVNVPGATTNVAAYSNAVVSLDGGDEIVIGFKASATVPASSYYQLLDNLTFTLVAGGVDDPRPRVDNASGASDVLETTATLNGTLVATGGLETAVWVFWGDTNGARDRDAWATNASLGVRGVGSLFVGATGLMAATPYYYSVYATNAAGEVWAWPASMFITDFSAAQAPSGLALRVRGGDRIDLEWTDNSAAESGFRIERSLDQSVWTNVGSAGPNATTHRDVGLTTNTLYYYRVCATNAWHDSDYSTVTGAVTAAATPVVNSYAWDGGGGADRRWSTWLNWGPNATPGNPDYLDTVAYENNAAAAPGTPTSDVDLDYLVKEFFVVNTLSGHTLSVPAGGLLAVDDLMRVGHGTAGSRLTLRGPGRVASATVTIGTGTSGGGTVDADGGARVHVLNSLTLGQNTGGQNSLTSGRFDVRSTAALQVGRAEQKAEVVLADLRTSGNTRTATGTLQAQAGSTARLDLSRLTLAHNVGSGSGNWSEGTLDLYDAEARLAADEMALATNSHSRATLRLGGARGEGFADSAALGNGRIELGSHGSLVVSNRLAIGEGINADGFLATGEVAVVSGATLQVGTPEAPGTLVLGRQITSGNNRTHTGMLTATPGSTNRFYLTSLVLGQNPSSGGVNNFATGRLSLDAGDNALAVNQIELGATAFAEGTLAFGAGGPLAIAAETVTVGRGEVVLGAQAVLSAANAMIIGRGSQAGVTGEVRNVAGSVLRVGSDAVRGTLIVGRQMASGNTLHTHGRFTPTAGSAVDLRVETLAIGDNAGSGVDNRARGELDLRALLLVTNAPAAGEARLDALTTTLGTGADESVGSLLLGAGTAQFGVLTVGGAVADRSGWLDLNQTTARVSGALTVGPSGVVTARVGAVSTGLDLLDGAWGNHTVTNVNLVFAQLPAQGGHEHWALRIAGNWTNALAAHLASGAIRTDTDALPDAYLPAAHYDGGANVSYVGFDLGLRVITRAPIDARLYGQIYATGGAENPDVFLCWGEADAGTGSTNDWEHAVPLGNGFGLGDLFWTDAVGLAPDRVYFYRCYVTNSMGDAWSDEAVAFIAGEVMLSALDGTATETVGNVAVFTVSRPAALTNGTLTVNYTVSGTATPGVDFAELSGSVTIPDGASSVTITVTPIDDEVWNEGAETVGLTLAPGGYGIGAPDSAVATIVDNEAPGDWGHHATLTFSGYTRTETLIDFPALVVLSENIPGFYHADFADPDGGDLRFTSGDGQTLLSHEIESWDTNGSAAVWVRVPVLSTGAQIRAYWGNPQMTAPPTLATNGSTWAAGYVGVWHLRETETADATRQGFDGTAVGTPTATAAGQVNGACDFDADTDAVRMADDDAFTLGETYTVSAWLRSDDIGNQWEAFVGNYNGGNGGFIFALRDNVANELAFWASGAWFYSGKVIEDNRWTHVAYVRESTGAWFYVDGQLVRSGTGQPVQDGIALELGGAGTSWSGYRFDGTLDEVRVTRAARSADWLWACWANQAAPHDFVTWGAIWPYPLVRVAPAEPVGVHAAGLNATLVSTGATAAAVQVFWGVQDGGTAEGNWEASAPVASAGPGALSHAVTNLLSETTYYYRYRVENAAAATWSAEAARLVTGLDATQYAHRMQIAVVGYRAAESLTHFPLLVKLDESRPFFRYADFGDLFGGADLRFTDANGMVMLPHQIETWNPGGTTYVWVQVPACAPRATLWAYWGRPGATTPAYTSDGSAWSADYAGVWHLNEQVTDGFSGATNHLDSSPNGNHAVQSGNNDQPAVVDLGQEMSVGDYLRAPHATSLSLDGAVTLSAWVKLNTYATDYSLVAMKGDAGSGRNYGLWVRNNGAVLLSYLGSSLHNLEVGGFSLGAWHHLAGVIDPASGYRAIYINGVRRSESTAAIGAPVPNTQDLYMGGRAGSWLADGLLDELRVSAVARSSNWVWASWANQLAPQSFAPCGVGWPLPWLEDDGVVSVTHDAATVQGTLWSTGAAPAQVRVYFGTQDGGENPQVWGQVTELGTLAEGPLQMAFGGLAEYTNYFYRVQASNAFGAVWATSTSGTFRTRANLQALHGTNYVGQNMDFETIGGWSGLGGDGFAYFGGATCNGNQMLALTGSDGSDIDIYQFVDLAYYQDAIAKSNVAFEASIGVNFINTSANNFQFWVRFYAGSSLLLETTRTKYTIDAQVDTWEHFPVPPGVVPPTTTRAEVHFRVEGGAPWSGYYVDCAELALIIPGGPPLPTALQILVR